MKDGYNVYKWRMHFNIWHKQMGRYRTNITHTNVYEHENSVTDVTLFYEIY